MAPELPGFYYDEDRGRYFRISSGREHPASTIYHPEQIKKRKINQRKQIDFRNIAKNRSKIYHDYMLQLSDPFQRVFGSRVPFQCIEGLKIESCAQDDDDNACDISINRSFGNNVIRHEMCNGNFICDVNSDGENVLIFATSRGLIRECVEGSLSESNLIDLSELTTLEGEYAFDRIEILQRSPRILYFHFFDKGSRNHFFGSTEKYDDVVHKQKLDSYENLYDSVSVGHRCIFAVNSRLRQFDSTVLFDTQSDGRKSDILSLAVGKLHGMPKILYAGCRDGVIYAIPVGVDETLQLKSMRRFEFPNVLSIISIKTVNTLGIIFVSAVSQGNQALFVFDSLRDDCKPLVNFQTTFLNLTREQEIFEVSEEGHYVSYGSLSARDGKGDVEVFSSYFKENLTHERMETTVFYPLGSLACGLFKNLEIQNTRLRAAGLSKNNRGNTMALDATDRLMTTCRLTVILEEINSRSPEFFMPQMILASTNV